MAWHRPKTNTSLPSSGFGFTLIYLKGYDLLKVYDKRDYFDFDLVNFPFFFFFFFFFLWGVGVVTFFVLPLTELKLLNSFDLLDRSVR